MRVSVLVPVYGVEKYVGTCAQSLFEQTYADLEYIFVDDCSPDRSVEIIQHVLAGYPQRQQQVHIVRHQQNKGLGAARKTALAASTGTFVLNVDSDDYLPVEAVEKLVACQQQTGADIVSGNYFSHYDDDTIVFHHECHPERDVLLKLMLVQHTVLPHIWGRLIRKTVYTDNGIDSVEGINMAEDMALTPRLIHAASLIAYIEDAVYYYREASSASTFSHQISEKHMLSYISANDVLWRYFLQNDRQREFLQAIETGMLNVFWQSLTIGISRQRIARQLSYRPQTWLFRLLHAMLVYRPTLPLLRFAYLAIKWCYKKALMRDGAGE